MNREVNLTKRVKTARDPLQPGSPVHEWPHPS